MRNDIQALRAAAVLMVIANHLFPAKIIGGYVGVDVFFVISGFLITSHLLREADGTGRVRLGAFWARRARRLLPAALLVLAVCAIVVVIAAPLPQWKQNLTQIAFAAGYGENWRLAAQSLDYFNQGQSQTLVTHYWSLSVEEQFYLVWPLIILAVYLVARAQPVERRRRILAVAFGALLLGSFAWAIYSVQTEPQAAYFETTGRAWEFAGGGLVAMLPAVPAVWRTRLVPVIWVAWIALVVSALVISPTWGVPGPAALLPVGATAIILAVGESERWFGTRYATGFWPVRTVGDISYSAYLWHWPIIVATPWFLVGALSTAEKPVILIGSLVIAWLSKRFIEDPVRIGRPAKWRPSRTIVAALSTMAIVIVATGVGAVAVQREATSANATLAAQVAELPSCFGVQAKLTGAHCPHSHTITQHGFLLLDGVWNTGEGSNESRCAGIDAAATENGGCSFGVPAGTQKLGIALVGDSHAYVIAPALNAIAKKYDARIFVYTHGYCSATMDTDVQFRGRTAGEISDCSNWRTTTINSIASNPNIDLVVTANRSGAYLTNRGTGRPDGGDGYARAWKRWLDSGKSVIALADAPEYPDGPVGCTIARDTSPDPCSAPLSAAPRDNALAAAAATIHNQRFAYADYTKLFCDTICHSVVGGVPVTRDGQHFTSLLMESFGDAFLRPELAQVLAASHK